MRKRGGGAGAHREAGAEARADAQGGEGGLSLLLDRSILRQTAPQAVEHALKVAWAEGRSGHCDCDHAVAVMRQCMAGYETEGVAITLDYERLEGGTVTKEKIETENFGALVRRLAAFLTLRASAEFISKLRLFTPLSQTPRKSQNPAPPRPNTKIEIEQAAVAADQGPQP